MKKIFISLGVVASLWGFSFKITENITDLSNLLDKSSIESNFFGEKYSNKHTYKNVSIGYAKFSQEDMQKEIDFFADPSRCFNAFSIPTYNNLSFSPFSILTQVQNEDFYLKIIRKHTKICSHITDLNVTLIDKNGNEIDYTPSSFSVTNQTKEHGYMIMPIKFNVHNAYRDVFVHFSYNIKNREVSCNGSVYAHTLKDDKFEVGVGASAKCYITTTTTSKEENATDDFAVRPKQFNISADSTAFVGKPLNIDITAIGANGKNDISTNYNEDDMDLNTITDPSNIYLSYFYNIINGKIGSHKFFFTKPSNDVKIKISEKLGKEWAIVDSDDTTDSRRLITPGESNSIKVLETSKNWAGVGTGEKENSPTNKTIQSDIRDNVNRNLKFNKMSW